MKRKLLLLILCAGSLITSFAQGLVINNDGYVVITNGAFVVVDEPSSNGIITQGIGGNIISENEFNRLQWNITTNSGTYIVPFTKKPGIKIPLTVDISAGGNGNGRVVFSTYAGPDWQNSNYLPSGVNNIGTPDSSSSAIDRFWLIDAQGFISKPALNAIIFSYDDIEWSAFGNTINESDLAAQWFNPNTNKWLLPIIGTDNPTSNTVTTPNISPNDFYRAWTLASPPLECDVLFIPNAFSPNNDGENDMECVFSNCIETLSLVIYDRWGEKVFETTDPKVCWDGRYQGKLLNTAVFVYSMKATLITGEEIIKKGNVSLIR